jgi:hypothetical protein
MLLVLCACRVVKLASSAVATQRRIACSLSVLPEVNSVLSSKACF